MCLNVLKHSNGGLTLKTVKVVLRNPLNYNDQVDYTIEVFDNALAQDWIPALKELLQKNLLLEKNFCFLGFPHTPRDLDYLCDDLSTHVDTINNFFNDYKIENIFKPSNLATFGLGYEGRINKETINPNQEVLNILHNHFEVLQGTVWSLSDYYKRADYETKYAIRQLNNICHEIETYILSQRKLQFLPYWIRPSQITTWLHAPRYNLKDVHRELFLQNGYDRVLGGVYMHWTQIGKTLFEVFRDEGAPELTETICEAITELKYFSGEFDVEWGNNIVYGGSAPWHDKQQDVFKEWLIKNNKDPNDANLSLGYLPIAQVNLQQSFGTTDYEKIWEILGSHLDIYKISIDDIEQTFEYCWSDPNYKKMQIDIMKPGYDYSSRR